MTAFGADRIEDVLAQCQTAAEAIGIAFSTAFDGNFEARSAQRTPLDLSALPEYLSGRGLILNLTIGETNCLVVLSQTDNVLPSWCFEQGEASTEKLHQLGVDLATALVPTDLEPQVGDVTSNQDLGEAVLGSQPSSDSVCVSFVIAKDEALARLSFLWPVVSAIDALPELVEEKPAEDPVPPDNDRPAPLSGKLPTHRRLIYTDIDDGIRQLPAYAQSLLRVRVPVTVTLAKSKMPVSKILDMGPGTILQFKKACDSNLTMEVGRQTVAEGEAVKVGDKFGLWITEMTMPSERFWSVNKSAVQASEIGLGRPGGRGALRGQLAVQKVRMPRYSLPAPYIFSDFAAISRT